MANERRRIWRVSPRNPWTTAIPVGFVIVSLLSLVALPLSVSRHTGRMRDEIQRIAEPARRSANQIQVDLAAEVDKIIAFQVTGQAQYRNAYAGLVARQQRNRSVLERLSPQLSPELERELSRVFAQTARWHNGVATAELVSRKLPESVFQTRLFEQHAAYEQALAAASELEVSLQVAIEDRLARIRSAERWNVSLTIILTVLALTSAMLVASLGRQMRLLAAEATRRRKDAEREAAEAKKARAAAEKEERRAAFLAVAGHELAGSLDFQHTINTLARLVVPNLAEIVVIDLSESDGSLRRVAAMHADPGIASRMQETLPHTFRDVPEVLVHALQERQPRLVGASSGLLTYALGGLESEAAAERTVAIVPLISRGETLGALLLGSATGKALGSDDLSLFVDLARQASVSIDNARLYLDSQQAVRAREEVLAIVSHDLRNPLNAVMLAASLLETSETLSDEDREQTSTIAVSARRMRRLIADLLDVTRLEGGKRLPIEPEPVDVQSLLREAHDLFKAQASASSVSLQYRAGEDIPPIFVDRHRIMQVLSNLVGNSLKFTPQGGVVAFVAEPREGEVLFTVSDTGPGIPPEHLDDIFSRYWQAKRTERMGAGLGLPIAKGIVESHGGKIWVESEQSVGTKFYFTLPVDRSVAPDLNPAGGYLARR
jgi:signal transduction histidine kinase